MFTIKRFKLISTGVLKSHVEIQMTSVTETIELWRRIVTITMLNSIKLKFNFLHDKYNYYQTEK